MRYAVMMVLCALLGAIGHGCQQSARAPDAPRVVKNIYDISITLDLRDETDAQEYYTVDRDGQLGFGGGMNARFERITYTGQLTADDMRRLREVIETERLMDGSLKSTNQPKEVYYRIRIRLDDEHLNRNLKGTNERIEALRVVLREFADRRLASELERLPKASATTRPASSTQPD